MLKNILSELRVLDFTRVLSGPYATRMLADFGAEVIKVQSQKIARGKPDADGYFDTWNRNKRSIALDMSHPEAREIAFRLVAICDVVIDNFSPRVMSNWGMDYQTLKKVKPDIIMLSMSAMGQTGPWRNHVAFGPTVQSLGGLTYLTSFDEKTPLGSGYALADHISGLYGAFVILSAMEHRERTGQGQYIDLSQYEVGASQIGPALLDVLANNHDLNPCGNQPDYVMAAPHGCYPCLGEEKWCVIGVFSEVEWQALVQVMGSPVWAHDSKFATLALRKTHFNHLDEALSKWTSKYAAVEVVGRLQKAGVPAGVVQNAEDLANDPHLLDRNFFVQIQHPSLGETFSDRSPIRFIQDALTDPHSEMDFKSAPLLGEANQYVFINLLGMTEQEYRSHIEKGIIA